jgi:opacity protein-like surface antigen
MKRLFATIVYFLTACALTAYPCSAPAQDAKSPPQNVTVSAAASAGYHFYTTDGNPGKAGEYDVLQSGAETSFDLQGSSGRKYVDMSGRFLDDNDLSYNLNLDLSRYLRSDFSYMRFQHYLEHGQLENQDFTKDYNIGDANKLIISELKANNTLLLPSVPFIKFNFDMRSYQKLGHRQATTVGKCNECHVTSRNKRINSSINDITPGMELSLGPATITYNHLLRSFTEHAAAPTANYGDGASFFLVKGWAPYSLVPDSKLNVDTVNIRSALPWDSTVYATVQHGKRENLETHTNATFNSMAARLSKYFSKYFTCDVYYNKYSLENKTSGGIDLDTKRGGFDLNMHPIKNSGLTCSYQWQDIERDNADPNSTRKNTWRISWNQRISKKIRYNLKYEKIRVNEPLVRKDDTFSGLVQTSLPKKEDTYSARLTWSMLYNVTLNTNLRYAKLKNSRYDSDEDQWEYGLSLWYVPLERLTLTGGYTLAKNKVNSFGALKTYHLNGAEGLFEYSDIPYDSRSQTWNLSAAYKLTAKITLNSEFAYVDSIADFDKHVGGRNIGNFSDLSIGQLQTSLGITYACTNRLTLNARYLYRDYNDHDTDYYDGKLNMISVGASWAF